MRLGAAEEPTEKSATALGAFGLLALQFLDPGLKVAQSLFLHQYHLGKQVRRARLAGH